MNQKIERLNGIRHKLAMLDAGCAPRSTRLKGNVGRLSLEFQERKLANEIQCQMLDVEIEKTRNESSCNDRDELFSDRGIPA